ncbi:MAG: class I SAM-dependent methyltransferase [Deltaproteobacteria bacterium]|nr:class I SAM-dependent methyltransferase [Deltaproteobacteria bacterium]
MTNAGAMKLLKAARTVQEWAVAETFQKVVLKAANGRLEVASLTRNGEYHADALTRFLNAAAFLGLAAREATGQYSVAVNAPKYRRDSADALFWLLNSGLANLLSTGSMHLKTISASSGFEPDMYSAAVGAELLSEKGDHVSLSPDLIEVLSPESRTYMGLWVKNYERVMSKIFSPKGLSGAIRDGRTQWPAIFGAEVSNPFLLTKVYPGIFNDLMEGMHQANITDDEKLAAQVDKTGVWNVLDIGGASGAWATALADSSSQIEDIQIYDLRDGMPLYQAIYKRFAASKTRPIRWVDGNFFEGDRLDRLAGLPEDKTFDLVSLGWIIHDWTDEQAVQILKRAAGHLHKNGRLLLLESIMDDDRLGRVTLADLTMLVQTGGRERTIGDYSALLSKAGLKLKKVINTPTRRQIIETVHG